LTVSQSSLSMNNSQINLNPKKFQMKYNSMFDKNEILNEFQNLQTIKINSNNKANQIDQENKLKNNLSKNLSSKKIIKF